MNDELETRLHNAFRGSLPAAPASLLTTLEEVPNAPVARATGGTARLRIGGHRPWRALAVAAVLLVGGAVAVSIGNGRPSPLPLTTTSPPPAASLPAEASAGTSTRLIYQPQWTTDAPYGVDVLSATVAIIRQRIDASGLVGVQIATDDQARIVVDLPAGVDPDPIRQLTGPTGHVGFVPLDGAIVEVGSQLDPATYPDLLDGIVVPDASVVDDQSGQPSLRITLGEPGISLFAEYTSKHIGSTFAITLDGAVIAAPVIESEVPDGVVQITFGPAGATDSADLARLATIIRLGPLPVAILEVADGPGPSASPSAAALPPVHCEARLPVDGAQLECDEAVRAALGILPADHPPIAEISFSHTCHDVIVHAIPDCFVQISGTVEVTFTDGSSAIRIAVSLMSSPSILPGLPLPDPSELAFTLSSAPSDLGCDAMRPPYSSLVIHIDPAAADPVWAMADTGDRLRTFWGPGFHAGTSPGPVVYDAHGVVVARDGTRIDIPELGWPNLAGYFVCPSTDAIYVLSEPPA
jgi:hypothetical protein